MVRVGRLGFCLVKMGQVGNGLVKKLDWVLVWFKFWIDY